MTIGVGSVVAIKLANAYPGIVTRAPLFGVVNAVYGSSVDVLWENGTPAAGVVTTVLDEITAAPVASVAGLLFRVVTPAAANIKASPECQGLVIAAFVRGIHPPDPVRVIVQSLSSPNVLYELLASQVQVVQGR